MQISDFVPGQIDHHSELNVPQVVFGRESETEQLLQAFQRTIGGPGELVLVCGEAGIGKTTLVNQLIRPVTDRMGLFLYAKYEQNHPSIYQGLTDLLGEFCRLVLSEPKPAFDAWREALQAAVAPLGKLLTDLCPQLEMVLGPQPLVDPVDEASADLRLRHVVASFMQAICRPDHPVVIFLDDLQWISHDSSLLWQSILSRHSLHDLLIVGAYRDGEIAPDHPVRLIMPEEGTAPWRVTRLKLENLDWSQVNRLVAATLASDPTDISGLATAVYLRTKGNPYFSREFLKSIYRDRLLTFNMKEQKWQWDSDGIDAYGVANNVVDLFVHEITNMDEDTQIVLQLAACTGRRFDTATLLAILGEDNVDTLAASLWQAMMEGLIYPLDENYRFLAMDDTDEFNDKTDSLLPIMADLLEDEIVFEFQHDRVQQAALAMLDERQLMYASLQIGSMLLEKSERTGQEAVQENITVIVNHLNAGRALIEDPVEVIKMAQLNLMASNQARSVAAYEAASYYLSNGMQLLPENSWQDYYAMTFELFTAASEVALLNGDLARAEALALSAEEHARSLLEKARLLNIRMDIYMIQTQLKQVIDLGIEVIKMLRFDLDLSEPPVLIPEQAMQLPPMTEPHALAVSRLVELLISAGYASSDPRLEQIVHFYIDLFSRFGNPPMAGYVYVSYAVIFQLSRFEQMEKGCKLGEMVLELAERGGTSRTLYAVRYVYYGFIHHWWRPARECICPLYDSFQPAVEAGSLWYSISMQDLAAEVSLFVGNKLEEVRCEQAEAISRVEFFKQIGYTQRLRMWSQVVLNLMGESLHPQELNGDLFTEDEARQLIDAGQNFQYMFYLYTARAFLSLLFRNPQQALESSSAAEALKKSAQNYLIYTLHLYIYSLALLSTGLDEGDLAARLEKVEENLRLMRLWAARVPENFLHQVELVGAEQARCLGHDDQAAEGYERAIQSARKNGYIHESALAAELAAEFYLVRGDTTAAIDHLFTAYHSYIAWGAKAKADNLANRYPQWLPSIKYEDKRLDTATASEGDQFGEIGPSIDLNSILKASLELAHETSLEVLLRKLMSILIENAGAQNGALVLGRNDRWYLEVQGSTDPKQNYALISSPLEDQEIQIDGPQVPLSIIHYVINSQVELVLIDASASNQFSQDPYIKRWQPKSILCAPLLNQGELSGVIYLENSLVAGAFTAERLEILQLISGQAAVSIEKARLYESLEALVEERTRELSDANRKLKIEIDGRKRVEEALRLSEERYRTIFKNTGTAMAVIDPDGYITLTNEEFSRLTGYSREVLEAGIQSQDLVAPADDSRIYQYRLDRLKDASLAPKNYEFRLVDRSGVEKSILTTAAVLPGTRTTIISLIDISQRKQSELKLQVAQTIIETEKQRYHDLFDFAPDAYLVTDVYGKIIEANHAAEELLGQENLAG
ncbi:MAG: PAS domain S-box protein, partial [Chloroflexota bacterium]